MKEDGGVVTPRNWRSMDFRRSKPVLLVPEITKRHADREITGPVFGAARSSCRLITATLQGFGYDHAETVEHARKLVVRPDERSGIAAALLAIHQLINR